MSHLEHSLELQERLRFESLELSVQFSLLATSQVDSAIEEAQRLFCESLGLDRSSLFQHFDQQPGALLTHHYERPGASPTANSPEKRAEPRVRSAVYCANATAQAGTRSTASHFGNLGKTDQGRGGTRPYRDQIRDEVELVPTGASPVDAKVLFPWVYQQLQRGQSVVISHLEELPKEAAQDRQTFHRSDTQSAVVIPLTIGGTWLGCLSFVSLRQCREWSEPIVKQFQFIAHVFANALARKRAEQDLNRAYAEIKELKDRLQAESDYLKAEIQLGQPHQGIIGRSQALRKVLHLVEQVAPTGSVVLLTGETGTGKELLARAIHRLSPRQNRLMIEVNCAALPETLAESELFGRERGAYTGALTSQMGRFEVADGSTIFLDEVGELSLSVQAKLLRILQEGQFQRLGAPKIHQVNVRVIAATNHDLAQAVQQGRFREDLFYRLNVFPIQVPPLRERLDDLPLLVLAFVEEFSGRMGKQVLKVPRRVMEALERHHWPGNIRELRNVIERGVILSSGNTLQLALLQHSEPTTREPLTLAQAEQQHILKVLEKTCWRIKGPHGAALVLGLKPGTLYSRMRKLGIPLWHEKDARSTQHSLAQP